MIPDFAIAIGSAHAVHGVCQDYARFGGTPDNAYVLVADGCSSTKDSEIGAKLLILAAEKYVQDELIDEEYHDKTIQLAQTYTKGLGLPDSCLDATLLTIRKCGSLYYGSIYGDGLIVQCRKDNILSVAKVSYASGYPNYLSYRLRPDRLKGMDMVATVNLCEIHPDGQIKMAQHYDIDYKKDGKTCHFSKFQDDATFMAIMTDGVCSFLEMQKTETSKANAPVPFESTLRELLAFKSFHQGFAKRRLQRALKDISGRGMQHYDDLTMGVLAKEQKEIDDKTWPPLGPGTRVRTNIDPAKVSKDWWSPGERKHGALGFIVKHHDSHGLCYDVKHDDGSKGCYDPHELITGFFDEGVAAGKIPNPVIEPAGPKKSKLTKTIG